MSEISTAAMVGVQAHATDVKKKKARKPKIVKAPGSFRLGVLSTAPTQTYGPCAFEVTVASSSAIGAEGEAEQIREFCRGFSQFQDLCAVKGYGVFDSAWKVTLGLNTEGKDVDDKFLTAMLLRMKGHFESSPVLKSSFGAGRATYKVLNGGTTVEEERLNFN